jgi:hypothetical protein
VVWLGDFPPIGFLSDFDLVPKNIRNDFKNNHAELIRVAFHDLIGRPLAFYPEGSVLLLIDQHPLTEEGPLDPELELARVTKLVIKLLAAKDDFAGHVRVLSHWTSL